MNCTRPLPVDGPFHQAAADWIHVNVLDGRLNHGWLGQVSIVAWALLRESKTSLSRPLAHRQSIKEGRRRGRSLLLRPL